MSDLVLDETGAAEHSQGGRSKARIEFALRSLAVCVAYYLGSLLGYALIFPSSYISIVWPPNAILLVALLLSPHRQWPWLLLIVFPVHFLAQAQLGVPPSAAVLYYVFNCVLVPLTAAALRRFGLGDLALGDLRQALRFIVVTPIVVGLGTLVWSPLIVSLWQGGGDPWNAWGLTFLSNLLPFLIATPGLVLGLSRGPEIVRYASARRCTEFALLAVGLLLCGLIVFGLAPRAVGNLPALFYAPLPFLLWSAVRFGPGGLSLSFMIFAVMAMFNAVAGEGPFISQSAGESVLRLQIFLLALYVPMLVLASGVEERWAKEKALRFSEARYRAVVEDQTELICRFLPDGTYTFVNDAYCRYFQRTREELLGNTFWSLIPPEGHQAAREFLASITPEHPIATREHEVLAADGELRWQQWRDRAFFDGEGRVVEYQAVGRDITERKHAEEAMRSVAHAGRLALVGELTGSIAHEINQPLGAILCNAKAAQLMLESESPSLDEVRKILADIREDDVRASEVIQRIRGLLARRETQMLPLDVNEIALEVVRLGAADAQRRDVALETAFAPGLGKICGDRVQLQQVLLNLLLNGMDAMVTTPPSMRRIVVHTRGGDDRWVQVSVTDAGHGVPPERLPRVFESFYTTKEDGMGLGLAIARSIVEVHGGRIWANNNLLGGATFTVALPLADRAAATLSPTSGPGVAS